MSHVAADGIRKRFDSIKKKYEESELNVYNSENFLKVLDKIREEVIIEEQNMTVWYYTSGAVQDICDVFENYIDESKKDIVQNIRKGFKDSLDEFSELRKLEGDIIQYMTTIMEKRNNKDNHMFDSLFGEFDRSEVEDAYKNFFSMFDSDNDKEKDEDEE